MNLFVPVIETYGDGKQTRILQVDGQLVCQRTPSCEEFYRVIGGHALDNLRNVAVEKRLAACEPQPDHSHVPQLPRDVYYSLSFHYPAGPFFVIAVISVLRTLVCNGNLCV